MFWHSEGGPFLPGDPDESTIGGCVPFRNKCDIGAKEIVTLEERIEKISQNKTNKQNKQTKKNCLLKIEKEKI
jgi:hypothetical protein